MKVGDILQTGGVGGEEGGDHAGSADGPGAQRWLISYADMITLLLAFFVIMLMASDFNPEKLEKITESTQKSLGSTGASKKIEVISIEELVTAVNKIIKQEKLEKQVEVAVTNRGVVISGRGAMFFESGDSVMLSQAATFMQKLSKQINRSRYNIAIEGHTDNLPISNPRFPSNWELSSARASDVVRFLIKQGVPANRLKAVGLADTVPKAPNQARNGKPLPLNQARNRRIEIVFLTS